MLKDILIYSGPLIAIGGILVALVTQLNHIPHLEGRISKIEEQLEKAALDHDSITEIFGKLDTIEALCRQRHKEE